MLKISKPLSAAKVQSYYAAEYTSSQESYYTQSGQLRGEWHGQLAAHFGLSGQVQQEHFDRLAEGLDPHTGDVLIKHRDTLKTREGEEIGHRAGFDLTFGAAKSVSLTALVGGDERLRAAHAASVREALDAAEKYVQARMGGDKLAQTTEKWAAALFEHDTARPVDGYPAPHLHTHVVMFNMTMADKIRSVDPKALFRIQSYASSVYHAGVAHRAAALGYEIENGKGYAVEIKGYTPEYIQAMSARTEQIRAVMEAKGLTGAEANERVAHQTRESKQVWDPEELKALHRAEAVKYGNQPERVVAAAAERGPRWEASDEHRNQLAHEAVSYAKTRLIERNAVFDHYELMRDALHYGQGTLTLPDVEAAFEQRRTAGLTEFEEVYHYRQNAPGRRFTTPEMIAMERYSIETMRAGIGQHQPIAATITKDDFREAYRDHMNNGQMHLAWNVLQSRDRIIGVQGGAGTGKTTALRTIAHLAKAHGYQTRGLAPTSGATKEMKAAGIQSETVQAHLMRPVAEQHKPRLYFLDESSLASTKQVHAFLERLQPVDRVLLVGDRRQHQSVEAGRIFAELQMAGMSTFRLDRIVRQRDEALRAVVAAFSQGKVQEGLGQLQAQGRITQIGNRSQRFRRIARVYSEAPEGTLVVSPDNESRKEINAAIRLTLREEGVLSEDRFTMRVLLNRQDVTGADRKLAASYHPGDVIRYARANETVGVAKGDYATVIATDRAANQVSVQRERDGKVVTYKPTQAAGVQLYETEDRSFARGERIQFTSPWKEKGIANRDAATITKLDQNGNVEARLDDSRRKIRWNLRDMAHVDHVYAMTSYSAQGKTVDRVLIQIEASDTRNRALVDQTLAYVATSRARYDAQIFTDDLGDLQKALQSLHLKPKALSREQIEQYAQGSKSPAYAVA